MSVEAALMLKGMIHAAVAFAKTEAIKGVSFVDNGEATPDDYGDMLVSFADGVTMRIRIEIAKPEYRTCRWCGRLIYNDATTAVGQPPEPPLWAEVESEGVFCPNNKPYDLHLYHEPIEGEPQ